MNKSEIFDSFVKIAQDKGLISEDAPEKAKKILEKTHRADSLDISAIEALYGTKPSMPKDMEYERNIIEDAHPNSVVISPSYDKLNGLVENNQERQDIILHIVNKTPNGHLTQHKYAKKDLLLSLVRLGDVLDRQNAEQLRVLSDACLEQIASSDLKKKSKITYKSLKKEGFVTLVAGAVAAVLGTLYAQQHLSFADEGFQQNHNKLISEIDDLLNSNSEFGVGNDYSADFKTMLTDFRSKIMNFYNLYSKVLPVIKEIEKPKDVNALVQISQKPETNTVIKACRVLMTAVDNMRPYLNTIEKNFSSESYKNRQIEDKGWISSLVDKTQVLHGGKGLVADDFDDVVRALAPYRKSINDMIEVLNKSQSIEKDAQDKIQQASMQSEKDFKSETPANPTSNPSEGGEYDDLEKDLTSGLL